MSRYEKDLIEIGRLQERGEILEHIVKAVTNNQKKRDQFERGSLNRAAMTVAIDELLYVGDFIMKRGAWKNFASMDG